MMSTQTLSRWAAPDGVPFYFYGDPNRSRFPWSDLDDLMAASLDVGSKFFAPATLKWFGARYPRLRWGSLVERQTKAPDGYRYAVTYFERNGEAIHTDRFPDRRAANLSALHLASRGFRPICRETCSRCMAACELDLDHTPDGHDCGRDH